MVRSAQKLLLRVLTNARTHPVAAICVFAAAMFCTWLVLTKSLPFVIADDNPKLALQLSPNHTVALLKVAQEKRAQLVAHISEDFKSSPQSAHTAARYAAPNLKTGVTPDRTQGLSALREEIRGLASKILTRDPLNARAMRYLAETADDQKTARAYMQAAFKRSRRESTAAFWLLNDSFQNNDYLAVVDYADILLRTDRSLVVYVMSYLNQLMTRPKGRAALIDALVKKPVWRPRFFNQLPANLRDLREASALFLDLTQTAAPATDAELRPYLFMLVNKGQAETAYSLWIHTLSQTELATLGRLFNGDFNKPTKSVPFDWTISNSRHVQIEKNPTTNDADDLSLHINVGPGRVQFGKVSQILLLTPGRYKVKGNVRGGVKGRRGFRWQLACLEKIREPVGETDQLFGKDDSWEAFSFDVTIPQNQCRAQELRLFHHARSASEELISGELWFDNLSIDKAASN